MLQKTWVKLFIWFLATFFFFLASGVIFSILKPGPSESEVMKFMMGMMSGMDTSFMGLAMDDNIKSIIVWSASLVVPIIVVSIAAGVLIRVKQNKAASENIRRDSRKER